MEKGLISIIVPAYNSEDTLARTLDSIKNQTYKKLEVLVIDDMSSDSTVDIIRKYEKEDSRFRYIEKERHGGVSHSRNIGIKEARGEFIQFADSDDFLEPDMCEKLHNLIVTKKADLAVCNFFHPFLKYYIGNTVLNMQKPREAYRFSQHTFAGTTPWNKLYRKECVKELFVEGVTFAEDELFVFANLKHIGRIATTSEKLYHYCIAPVKDADKQSALNKIAGAEDFYKTKQTYWFKRADLMDIQRGYLDGKFGGKYQKDLLYQRQFDFIFWEIMLFDAFGCGEYGIAREIEQVFRDERFLEMMKQKEKHGLKYTENLSLVDDFVSACLRVLHENDEDKTGVKTYDVFVDLFAAFFTDLALCPDFEDQAVRAVFEMRFSLTPEAKAADKIYREMISYEGDEEFIEYTLGYAF